MRERPILFSGPMVKAILAGAKTQTRRVVKGLPEGIRCASALPESDYQWRFTDFNGTTVDLRCPYGRPAIPLKPQDRLWVRETWALMSRDGSSCSIAYRARLPEGKTIDDTDGGCDVIQAPSDFVREPDPYNWRPSIFMPRWASRITLEIKTVGVERLQEITTEAVIAEGFSTTLREHDAECELREMWQQGWEALNAKRGFGWETNPFVWVIEFRRVDQ